jgi:hypothetical protein
MVTTSEYADLPRSERITGYGEVESKNLLFQTIAGNGLSDDLGSSCQ